MISCTELKKKKKPIHSPFLTKKIKTSVTWGGGGVGIERDGERETQREGERMHVCVSYKQTGLFL